MNALRRLTCWLLVAVLLVGGIASATALAGHAEAVQQADCASMDAAHPMASGDDDANLRSAGCDADQSDCLDVRCVQSPAVPATSGSMLAAALSAPVPVFDQTASSLSPLPAYRPPRG